MTDLRFLPAAELDAARDHGARLALATHATMPDWEGAWGMRTAQAPFVDFPERPRLRSDVIADVRREGDTIVTVHRDDEGEQLLTHRRDGWVLVLPAAGGDATIGVPISLAGAERRGSSAAPFKKTLNVPRGTQYWTTERGVAPQARTTENLVVEGPWYHSGSRSFVDDEGVEQIVPSLLAIRQPAGHTHFYVWDLVALVANGTRVFGDGIREAKLRAYLAYDGDVNGQLWIETPPERWGASIRPHPKPLGPRLLAARTPVVLLGDEQQWERHAAVLRLWHPLLVTAETDLEVLASQVRALSKRGTAVIAGGDLALRLAEAHPEVVLGVVAIQAASAAQGYDGPVLEVPGAPFGDDRWSVTAARIDDFANRIG